MNYKQKCYLLLGGFLVALLVIYWFSFSDTLSLFSEIKEKGGKLEWLKEKEKEFPALKEKMSQFESVCQKNDTCAIRDHLTAFISDFSDKNNCLVTEIPANSSFKNEQIRIQTNTFTIRGDFHQLLTLLSKLESDYRYITKIMSAKFFTIPDVQTKRKHLFLTIITQSFEK